MKQGQGSRIAKNTIVLYFRMLLLMPISLVTSRVILQALGVTDFGIYNVVGGVVSVLGLLTGSISNASQRYLNIGLSHEDQAETERYFKQSFTLLLAFSAIVLLAAETVGLWFVTHVLVIPEERMFAAICTYQCSLLTLMCTITQVSFLAAIIAHERMTIYAYIGIFEAVVKFAICFLLLYSGFDHLILYSMLMALISVVTLAFHVIYCFRFPEVKLRLYWSKELVREMSGLIGAGMFGCVAWAAGMHGTNIVLNLFFGPVVNAARAITIQVNSVVTRFTENVMTAVKPAIIQSYAREDYGYMRRLLMLSSKFSFLLTILLSLPLIVCMPDILQFWLGNVPDYAVIFSRITLLECILGSLLPPLWIVTNATSDVKVAQVWGRCVTMSSVLIGYLLLLIDRNPIWPIWAIVVTQAGYLSYCLYDVRRQLSLSLRHYSSTTLLPGLAVGVFMYLLGQGLQYLLVNVPGATLLIIVVVPLSGMFVCWLLATQEEKSLVLGYAGKFAHRFKI